MSDIAKAASGTTEPELVSQPVQHPPPSVESLDAALTAARRIGGQQSHVTKLLQQLRKLLVEKGEASEVLGLQTRVKEAHQRWIQRGVWGGAHPPKIFQNATTRGSGGGGGGGGGVNCVIVTIKCIVILGILIFFLSIPTLNHDIYLFFRF